MVARRELQFTPDLFRPKQHIAASGTKRISYNRGALPNSTSGIPSPQTDPSQTDRVIAFQDSVPDAVMQKQRRQRELRFRAKGMEALGLIAVSSAFSAVAIMALARLIPYQTAQRERLDEITAEVQAVERRVEALRYKFPQMFNSGKSKDALIRQYGFVKPNQIPIKILDSTSSSPKSNNPNTSKSNNSTLPSGSLR